MEKRKVKVVILPTKEKPRLGDFIIMKVKNHLVVDDELQCGIKFNEPQNLKEEYYHLYFLSNEEIKEGDWYYSQHNNQIQKWDKTHTIPSKFEFKIIATTDKLVVDVISLDPAHPNNTEEVYLPHPTTDFIKVYVKIGGIDEVMVEYETLDKNRIWTSKEMEKYPKLKVNSYNEITIHPVKDCWNKEEVISIIRDYHNKYVRGMSFDSNPYQLWIKEKFNIK